MRYPNFLKANGTIGIIAPSFGCTTEPYKTCFEEAQRVLRKKGHSLLLGPNCSKSDGIGKSTTAEACGAEINDFFLHRNCDVILTAGGGETMCEDLPFIDFDAIRNAPPKWLMGFSDITNLTFTLTTLCDTASIYGPCVSAFGMRPWHQAVKDAYLVLRGMKRTVSGYPGWELESLKTEDNPLVPYNITEPPSMKICTEDPVHMHGRLLGGCLDSLAVLCGTPFDRVKAFCSEYASDGIIWFMEAYDLSPFDMRRVLWQLDSAGWFRNASGFLFGRSVRFGESVMGLDFYSAAESMLDKYNVPILMDLDIGHLSPMMPLICGSLADVSASGSHISIDMNLV